MPAAASAPADTSIPSYDGALYKMLVKKLPGFVVGGRLVVNRLADALGVTRQAVYRWLGANDISEEGVQRLIRASEGQLTPADLAPFYTPIERPFSVGKPRLGRATFEGPLRDILVKTFPDCMRDKGFFLWILARDCGLSPEVMRRCLKTNHLSTRSARVILMRSAGRLSEQDIAPFRATR